MRLETRVGLFILVAIGVFLYLSINIRALRLDKDQYNVYKAFFDDTSGLAIKAPVKIAGVEVGWVEKIALQEDGKAELFMRISKDIKLSKTAHAVIHQDGLIGTKNLEIDPGDPTTGFLLPGSTLSMPGRTPASVGELLDQFRDIATTIQDITASFKNVFASRKGEENMRQALNSIAVASDRIANFSEVLQRTMINNEDNFNAIASDLRGTIHDLKIKLPPLTDAIQTNFNKFGEASDHFSDAAIQGRDTLKEAGEVVEKINSGKGVVGKLINEDETYTDLKKTIKGFKDYISKTQALMLTVDMHSETMLRHKNAKGYFELRLRPESDYFYLLQLVGDEQGTVTREVVHTVRKDEKGNVMRPSNLDIPLERKVEFADQVERTIQQKNAILFGLQFGKRFDRLAFRVGVFESTFGVGCDFYVPLATDKFHWITTLEVFDFDGYRRVEPSRVLGIQPTDNRPHVKWLNRTFFMKNLYTTFGLDDICSKRGANPFFGGGLKFNDDDLKYFLSSLVGARTGGR